MKYFWALTITLAISGPVLSQSGYTLGKLSNVAASGFNYNPALNVDQRINIGIPVIGGIGASVFSPSSSYNDLSENNSLQLDKVLEQSKGSVQGAGKVHIDLLQGGFYIKNMWIRAGITDQVNFLFEADEDLVDLMWNGNGSAKWVGQTVDASNTHAFGVHFREYKAGMSLPVFSKWQVGFNVKAIQGIAALYTNDMQISLKTDADTYALTADISYNVQSSGLNNLYSLESNSIDSVKKYMLNPGNWGFGVDFGVRFQATEDLHMEASVLNLGQINWNTDLSGYKLETSSYTYRGVELSDLIQDNTNWSDFTANLSDSAYDTFSTDQNFDPFKTKLNAQIMFGMGFNVGAGGEAYTNYMQYRPFGQVYHQVVIGYRQDLKKWLSATVNGAVIGGDIFTLGTGLMFKLNPVQLYLATDHLLGLIDPYNNRAANISIGLNLVFGTQSKKNEPGQTGSEERVE